MADDRTAPSETDPTDRAGGIDEASDSETDTDIDDKGQDQNENQNQNQTDSTNSVTTPGGGPQRVVSSQSVDDILESLNETPTAGAKDQDDAASESTAEKTSPTERTDSSASESESEFESETESTSRETTFDETEIDGIEPEDDEGSVGTDTDTISPSSREAATDTDLESRIDSGAITGADVRTAEAGEGRDPTPEVDEIDISLEDLEQTTSAASTSSDDGATDGPLAGQIEDSSASDRPSKADESDDSAELETDDESDSSGGILGRLRGLFSR